MLSENQLKNEREKGVPHCKVGVVKDMSTWRVVTPVIDYSKCIKCLTCWMQCPDVAYKVVKGSPKLISKNCKGCGICAEHCPVKCIRMVKK
ncbi:4Fe-4S binding protein [archaeon]|jgi:2-oxoacid:acceptor oxidoreductase delta subunit (pyruvate/2-ketoisovalerate family)|nr:4Fe-4S binding protein [archaeon]MBT4416578.1 4Fe-4S binding protein [archaeon]